MFVLGGQGIRGERRLTFILGMVERGGGGDIQGEGLNGIGKIVTQRVEVYNRWKYTIFCSSVHKITQLN